MVFDKMPAEPRELLRQLIKGIPGKARSDDKPGWTRAVKAAVREESKKRGWEVCATAPHRSSRFDWREHEWLLDAICWSGPDITLAVECEWDRKDVPNDFQKLMAVKSPLKLMVFEAGPKNRRELVLSIEQKLNEYGQHVDGEVYLLLDFAEGSHHCSQFESREKGNGKLTNKARFGELLDLCGQDHASGRARAA